MVCITSLLFIAISPLILKKFHWGTIFPTGPKRYRDPKEEPIEKEPLMELKEIVISLMEHPFCVILEWFKMCNVVYVFICALSLRGVVLEKIQKYEWVKEQEEAFQTLKDNLCDTPILSLPDGSKEFVVYCDASNQGLGCVLMQRGKVENATAEMLRGLDQLMERKEGGGMYLLWVPLIGDVRTLMMDEAHASRYLVHSGADKTYYDLRDMYGGHVWRRILLPMLAIV
ncbi:putative reverse transcriptase domain-containing protein [Tanacetum coccineum]